MLLAEASKPELLLKAFDVDYAWPLHARVEQRLLNGAPATEFKRSWEESRAVSPGFAAHAHSPTTMTRPARWLASASEAPWRPRPSCSTLDGVPLLYNGMEVGDATESGDPALFEKMPIFWKPKDRPPLRDIYRDLIELRKGCPAFRNDRVDWLRNSQEADLVTFLRPDTKEEFVVVINISNRPVAG